MGERRERELMLLLNPEEHRYLMDLLLDYGAYKEPKGIRNQVVEKMATPLQVRDVDGAL